MTAKPRTTPARTLVWRKQNLLKALLLFLAFHLPAPSQAPPPAPALPQETLEDASPLTGPWPGQGDPRVERARRCILERESRGDYTATDRTRRWFGGYQFQLRVSNLAARRMKRPELIGLPASQWSPADQDAAFYLIYNRGRGRKHWAGGPYPCL